MGWEQLTSDHRWLLGALLCLLGCVGLLGTLFIRIRHGGGLPDEDPPHDDWEDR